MKETLHEETAGSPPLTAEQRKRLEHSLELMEKQVDAMQLRLALGRMADCEEVQMAAIMRTFYGSKDVRPDNEEVTAWGQWLFDAIGKPDVPALERLVFIARHLASGKELEALKPRDFGLKQSRGNPGRAISVDMIFCAAASAVVLAALEGNYLPSREVIRHRINVERKRAGLDPANFASWESELQHLVTDYELKGLLLD